VTSAFVLGLVVRLLLLPYKGTADMDTYLDWGQQTLTLGLPNAYSGGYFPVAFQGFATTIRVADILGISQISAVKLVTLCCDVASFALIVVLLRRWRAPLWYALLYWLSPFFLAVYWLGYVDAEMAVLLLASLTILAVWRGTWAEVAAGIPLGLLAALKPQGLLVVGAIVALAVLSAVRRRQAVAPLAMTVRLLAFSVALFAFYSWWIATSVHHDIWYLAETVRGTDSAMPSLSANMPNIWLIVSTFYVDAGKPLYTVMEPTAYRTVGLFLTAALILAALWWLIGRVSKLALSQRIAAAIAAVMLIYPFTITAAHENHLFVGGVTAVLIAAVVRDRYVTVFLCSLLALQFVNLFWHYRFGLNDLSDHWFAWMAGSYTRGFQVTVAALSTLCWAGLVVAIGRALEHRASGDGILPTAFEGCDIPGAQSTGLTAQSRTE
jgi:hypothetical protein